MVSTMGPRASRSSASSTWASGIRKISPSRVPWVDHLGAATDQRLSRMDYCQVSLGVLAPVFHRVQKLRIGSGQTGQLLGIELVGLTLLAIDQPSLTRISDQYLVATLG